MIQNKVRISVVFDRKHVATPRNAAVPHVGLIQLKVLFNKKYLYIAIASVYADEFGRKIKGRIVGDTVHGRADAEHINAQITDMRKMIIEQVERCNRMQVPFSLDLIKNNNAASDDFIAWLIKSIRSDDTSKGTKKVEMNLISLLKQFGLIRTFADVTTANITAFDQWMQQKHQHDNKDLPIITAMYRRIQHRTLKKYINKAIRLDLLASSPYVRFQVPTAKAKPRVFLTEEQVQKIAAYDGQDASRCNFAEHLLQVRDMFLIQCFTGMAFSDIMEVDWPSSRTTNTIIAGRHKTGVQYIVRFLPPVIEILERYDYKMPRCSYEVYMRALHHIQKSIGLNVNLTSHVGRHTFATTFGLRSGVPIELLSKMLGHTNISTTQIYAKILPDQVLDAFNKIKIPKLK